MDPAPAAAPASSDAASGTTVGALGGRARQGAIWLGMGRFAGSVVATVRIPIVAQLIGPEEIGSFGVALVVLGLLDVLSQTGLSQALIQKSGIVRPYLGSVWGVQAIRGFVLAALLFFAAPLAGGFFGDEGVVPLLRLLAVVPALIGLQALVDVQLRRQLAFGKLTLIKTSGNAVEAVVTITAAYIEPSAWALVIGRIAATTFQVSISWFLSDDRTAHLSGIKLAPLRELHRFGIWIFVAAIASFSLIRGGDLVLVRMTDTETLGIYQMATVAAMFFTMEVARVTNTIGFPLYSKLQNERARLRSAFHRTYLLLATLVIGVVVVTVVQPTALIRLIFGDQFDRAIPIVVPLAIWGACRALGAAPSGLLQAMGRPRDATYAQLAMLLLFAIGIVPAIRAGGAAGLAWLLAGVGTVVHVARYEVVYRALGGRRRDLFLRLGVPGVAAVVAFAAGRLAVHPLADGPAWLTMLVGATVSGLVYVIGLAITSRVFSVDPFSPMLMLVPDRVRQHRVMRLPILLLTAMAPSPAGPLDSAKA
ncbi:MAG: oligosaccharide flippase family protein [Planctomycetota bacterium]